MSETLPQGWATAYLMDLIELHDNKRIPLNGQQRLTMQGHYPYYGANGQVDSINDYLFDGDFILLAEDGGYFENPLRGVAYEVSGKFWVNNHAHILKPKNEIPLQFLKHRLNTINWMQYVGGSTRLKLTQQAMHKIQFPLPPLAEQKRIVAKLEALLTRSTNARNELAAIPKLIERYKQAVLTAAFRGDLTADWRGTTELVGWEEVLFKDIVDSYQNGLSKRTGESGEEVIVLRLADIKDQKICLENTRSIRLNEAEQMRYEIQKDDLLIIRVNGSNELVGRLILGISSHKIAYCDHFIRLRLNCKALTEWVCRLGDTKSFRKYINDHKVSSAGQNTVSQGTLNNFIFLLPPIEEQRIIVERIQTAFKAIDTIQAELTQAEALRKRLEQATLAKAFKGKLVPQNPNDEPASVLLERIRAEREAQPKSKRTQRIKPAKEILSIQDELTVMVERSNLLNVIKGAGKPVTPEELLRGSIYSEDTIEDFYAALKLAVESKQIVEDREGDKILLRSSS